jgi:hypothetical protein
VNARFTTVLILKYKTGGEKMNPYRRKISNGTILIVIFTMLLSLVPIGTMSFVVAEDEPTLSVAEGDTLRGTKILLASSTNPADQLAILLDKNKVPATHIINNPAELIFEADGVQSEDGFKNGVLIGDTVVKALEKNVMKYATVSVAIPPGMLKEGLNKITLRAGNKVSPTDLEGNHDDWTFRNVRLVLADGTVLQDPAYDAATKYSIGDGYPPIPDKSKLQRDFNFTISSEKARTTYYKWDTTASSDGEHVVELKAESAAGQKSKSARVFVDNTGPVVDVVSPKENKTYKGVVDISATATDAQSGLAELKALLDGKPVNLPSSIPAGSLVPGEHKLEVTATDKAGNKSNVTVPFITPDETPNMPSKPEPADGSTTNVSRNPKLSVTVSDPTNDALDVTLYRAYKYDFKNRNNKQAFFNASETEPPTTLQPEGENPFNEEAYNNIAAPDGKYFNTNSKEKFPYQRFDLKIEEDLTNQKSVEVTWKGHSLPERVVTMYAWNYKDEKWQAIDSGSGDKDFTMKGTVDVANMVRDKVVKVLIQDKIPSPDEYDFTFAWMSDTQFYSQDYPKIYDSINQWIVDNQKEKKITYVLHTGDIVNTWNDKKQWERASASMKILDQANVPYGVVSGNHDVASESSDYSEYWKYFGKERFANKPYYGGELDNNRDHYDLISAKGNDFIILYLGWSIDQQTIDWANQVLKKYADRNAIIATHEYLTPNATYGGQGKEVFDKIVTPNKNAFMVVSGHYHGVAYRVQHIGDRAVIEMLHDYQAGPEGGQGYIRLLQFDLDNKQMYVNTYSPYKNDYNFFDEDGKDEFTLPVKLQPTEKLVATDYISLNLYSNEVIGSEKGIPSGSKVEAKWKGLDKGVAYFWYVTAEDKFGGRVRSDIWKFITHDNNGQASK